MFRGVRVVILTTFHFSKEPALHVLFNSGYGLLQMYDVLHLMFHAILEE